MLLLDLLDPLWPTHFVGYLNDLMAVHGILECFENALLRQMTTAASEFTCDVF